MRCNYDDSSSLLSSSLFDFLLEDFLAGIVARTMGKILPTSNDAHINHSQPNNTESG